MRYRISHGALRTRSSEGVMRALRIIGISVVTVFVALSSAAYPTMAWFVLAGVIIGVGYWYPKKMIASLVLLGLTVSVTYLFLRSSSYPSVVPTVEVRMQVDARYDPHRKGWIAIQEFTIPPASMKILTEEVHEGVPWLGDDPIASIPVDPPTIQDELQQQGWLLARTQNNDPVFRQANERFQPAEVPTFPLRSPLSVYIETPNVRFNALVADERSFANLTAPMGLIVSTEPPSDPKRVPGGEQRHVEISTDTFVVTMEAASPLARFEPISSILNASGSSMIGYVVAALVGLFLASLKDRVKARIDRLFQQAATRRYSGTR